MMVERLTGGTVHAWHSHDCSFSPNISSLLSTSFSFSGDLDLYTGESGDDGESIPKH